MKKNKVVELRVRMTEDDKSLIEKAAKIRGISTSQFVREQLVSTSKMMVLVKSEEISEQSFLDLELVRIKELSKDAST